MSKDEELTVMRGEGTHFETATTLSHGLVSPHVAYQARRRAFRACKLWCDFGNVKLNSSWGCAHVNSEDSLTAS